MDFKWVWSASFTNLGSQSVAPCIYALTAPAAPPPPPPPLPLSSCCGRGSGEHTFPSASTSLGCVPMAIPYPAMAGRCIGVPVFGKVEVQSQVSSFVTRGSGAIRSSYIAPKPLGADDTKAKDAASKDGKILSRPPRFPLALTQNVPEHASKKSADAGAPFRFGLRVDGAPTAVHAATVGRPRRVTRRVSGSRTPQPYQRRRRGQGAIDDHVLQVPGQEHVTSSLPQKVIWKRNYCLADDYEEDVMKCLLEVERRHMRTRSYLSTHPSVNQRTRAILVDWLIQVQSYLELSSETLYQSISLVDRVLEIRCVPVHRVQLLAITSLLIVSKLEEKRPTETSDLLQLTLNSYTRAELLSLERQVLSVLKFELSCADQGSFLNYFLYLTCNDQDNMVIDCSGFLLGIVLVEAWPLETRPSLLAAAALHGALVLVRSSLSATAVCTLMPAFFSLDEEAIVGTSLRMLEALENRRHSPFQGAENKYSSRSRHNALAKHPRLSPENIRLVVEQVRMRVVELRGENTVIRDRLSDGGEKKREASEPVCSARDKFSLADAFVDGMRVGGIHERGVEMDLASERREKNGEEKQGEREMDVDI